MPFGPFRRSRPSPAFLVALVLSGVLAAGVVAAMFFAQGPDSAAPVTAPVITFEVNETFDSVRVNATDSNVSWNAFQFKMNKAGSFRLAGDDNVTPMDPDIFARPQNESIVSRGDTILFCLAEAEDALEVDLRHRASKAIVDSFHFTRVAPCDAPPEDPDGPGSAREAGDPDAGEPDADQGGDQEDAVDPKSS